MSQHRAFHCPWEPVPLEKQVWRRKAASFKRWAVEIGAGVGWHAVQYAKQHPETCLLAFERTTVKARKMLNRVEKHPELSGLMAFHADAVPWMCRHLFDEELDELMVLYPNPYPKPSQANKRFVHMPVWPHLLSMLKVNGLVTIATNLEWYQHEVMDYFSHHVNFVLEEIQTLTLATSPRSHFERKYLQRGEPCINILARKRRV